VRRSSVPSATRQRMWPMESWMEARSSGSGRAKLPGAGLRLRAGRLWRRAPSVVW